MADRSKKLQDDTEVIDLDLELIEEELDLELESEDEFIPSGKKSVSKPVNSKPANSKPVNRKRRSADSDMLDPTDTGAKKKKLPKFWLGFAIYGAVLLVLAIVFLIYTDSCLRQYENSQPGNVINKYLEEFEKKIDNKTIAEDMTLPAGAGKFESSEAYLNAYYSQFQGDVKYSAKKNASSYATEEPVYDIYAGDNVVAHVTLKATDTKTIFAILTIMDWDIQRIEPVCNKDTHDYIIKAPQNYTVKINDIALGGDEMTGKVTANPDFKYVSEYVSMPSIVEYKVEGFIGEPVIKIYDSTNCEVTYVADEKGNIDASNAVSNKEVPKEYSDLAFEMAKMWSNFTTRDLKGANYGLETIRQYLIKDSYYWNMATSYAKGVDITFVSAHTLKANPYSNVKISNYVSYGENCFSCHVYFDKAMHLTKTGATVVETMDSTFYFVKYDDSNDGVNNPHWAIVDMIATTE